MNHPPSLIDKSDFIKDPMSAKGQEIDAQIAICSRTCVAFATISEEHTPSAPSFRLNLHGQNVIKSFLETNIIARAVNWGGQCNWQ